MLDVVDILFTNPDDPDAERWHPDRSLDPDSGEEGRHNVDIVEFPLLFTNPDELEAEKWHPTFLDPGADEALDVDIVNEEEL